MKFFSYAVPLCVFLSVVFSSQILADTVGINIKLKKALGQAEKQVLSDPLGGRHLMFAYAAITAPTGYANILMNLARDPAVRQVVLGAQDDMQTSVMETWLELGHTAEILYPGSNPNVDWMTKSFYGILKKGFFPTNASENAALFMQSGPVNAYTWSLGPNAPMLNIFDSLIELMSKSPDAILSVLGHELGHNQGLHIWVQVIWGAIADQFGRIIIPNPDTIPGDIFSGIPEALTAKFTTEQKIALNRYFSGMSRADLDMKLSQRLDHIVEFIRNDLGSRTGRVPNHHPSNPKEIAIRSLLSQVMRRMGDQLYQSKGRNGFMLWAAQLATDVMNMEQIEMRSGEAHAGVKIDKKVSAWAQRLQEYHADLLGLINLYFLFDGDLQRAITACASADAYLAGGRFANVEAVLVQSKEIADLLRINPQAEAATYERVHQGMKSHSEPIVRAGMYELFAQSPAFKIVTDPFNRALWIYSELRRAMDREVKQEQRAGEAMFQSEWVQGKARLQNLIDMYEKILLKAFKDEAVKISLGKKRADKSLYARLFDFIDLYRQAQRTDSPKVLGRWDWNISGVIGGPETFLAELRHELQKLIAEIRQQENKNGKQINKLVQLDSLLGQAGISPPRVSLKDRLIASMDAEPGSPESVLGNVTPKPLASVPKWLQPEDKHSLACGSYLVPKK